MSVTPENRYLVTLAKDEYVGVGVYKVLRRVTIQLSISEYLLIKSAFGVIDTAILDQEWHINQRERTERLNLNR